MNKILFKEEQQFRQWWQVMLFLATTVPLTVFFIYALYQQTVNGIEVGDKPAPNGVLVLLIFIMFSTMWFYYVTKLEIWIDTDGLHYRFFPLIFRPRIISKAEIQKYEIRKYNAYLDYGGYGIKRRFKWGKGYIVSGSTGLQLYLTNGKKVLFGTQKSNAILYAMDELMNQKK